MKYIYDECRNKKRIDFDYVTKTGALTYARTLARRMNYASQDDIKNLLFQPYAFETFDSDDIA